MKKLFKKIHLWLGLIIGLFVIIIAVTGCIYAFETEIRSYTEPYRTVTVSVCDTIPKKPSEIKRIAEVTLPNKKIHSVAYGLPNQALIITYYNTNPLYYYQVFINPYSGKVLHIQNMQKGFLNNVLWGHMYLWLPPQIGAPIVLIITLLFVIIIISGIIIWIPKKVKYIKQRLQIHLSKKLSWKRKNWNLHTSISIYTLLFALVFIITGLVWIMPGFANFYHKAIGGTKSMQYVEPVSQVTTNKVLNTDSSLDYLWQQTKLNNPNLVAIDVHIPEHDTSSILIETNTEKNTYWKRDYVFYNQHSLAEMPVKHIWGRFKNADLPDRMLRMNYDIHTGSILGITGKIIAAIASLLIASLPVTGFFIWYGRNKKQ